MDNFAAADDIPFLLGLLAFAIMFSFAAAFSVGRLLMRANRWLAVLVCGLFVPLLFVTAALLVRYALPDQPPPNEAKGLAYLGLMILGGLATPISLMASYLAVLWIAKRAR